MRNNPKRKFVVTITAVLSLMMLVVLSASAKTKPSVVIIKADWCGNCKKLDPIMMDLMKQYGDRVDFKMLDVTNDDKIAESKKMATQLGLGKFFEENKDKTSTVAVFTKGDTPTFITYGNFDKQAYIQAFDQAIKKANM